MQTSLPPHKKNRRSAGFSLIELLTVIAAIGILGGIGISSVSNINEAARSARDSRNAQNACAMYAGATATGIQFSADTKEGILDELIAGKVSNTGIRFKLATINGDLKTTTLTYIEYSPTTDILSYLGPDDE